MNKACNMVRASTRVHMTYTYASFLPDRLEVETIKEKRKAWPVAEPGFAAGRRK